MDAIEIQTLYELGKSLVLQGNVAEAQNTFSKAIEEARYVQDCPRGLLYKLHKTRLDLCSHDERLFSEYSSIILGIFNEDPDYAVQLIWDIAQVHKMNNNHDMCIHELEVLRTRFPQNGLQSKVALELALEYHQIRNQPNQAMRYYIDFLNDPNKEANNISIAAVNLAACYNAINQPEQAKDVLKRYLNVG